MKSLYKLIIICFAEVGLLSCTDMNSWGDDTYMPSLKSNYIYFPQSQVYLDGGANNAVFVELKSINTSWKFSNPASDWLEISPMDGTNDAIISFTARENPTSDNIRTTVVELQSTDDDHIFSRLITVNQGKAYSILNPTQDNIAFSRESQSTTLSISSNTEWTANTTSSWIHLKKVSDKLLEIKVDENNEESERSATITLAGSSTSCVYVTQSGISINFSQSHVNFSREAQTKIIDIISNYSWTASCDANWVHLLSSPTTGKLYISVDSNNQAINRTANIYINGGKSYEINVSQDGVFFTPSHTKVEFSPIAQSKVINVTSNFNWTVSCDANWVKLKASPTTGELSISVEENIQAESRCATIVVDCGNITEIKVIQMGTSIVVSQSSVEFSRDAQTKNISISSNVIWEANCLAPWIHLTSYPEDGILLIGVDENKGTTDRVGTINISKSPSSIEVVQHGYVFEDLISEMDFPTNSSVKTLDIKTDGKWNAISNESWIHVTPSSGTTSAKLNVSVDDNHDVEIRKGTISITVGEVTKYVSVQQNGAYFDVSVSGNTSIPARGGTREITFSTSENWSVDCSNPSWVSVDMMSGTAGVNTITLAFSENMDKETRTDTTYIRSENKKIQDIRIITVQEGMYLYLISSSTSEIPAEGGTRTVKFASSENWFVDTKNTSWISVDKSYGNAGVNTINIDFSKNEEYSSRINTISIISSNVFLQRIEVTSTQIGKKKPTENGHEYIDLALPSGTMWADCNIGAFSPSESGSYYAWGETITKTNYTESNYTYSNNPVTLPLDRDAASVNWGGRWRMPTENDFYELYRECTWKWTEIDGKKGYKVSSSKNGNSIFMPVSYNTASLENLGFYWSSTLSTWSTKVAYVLYFDPSGISTTSGSNRYVMRTIRPVFVK